MTKKFHQVFLIILFVTAILSLSGCAHYKHDPWTKKDTAYHAASTILMAIDWRQTKYIANDDRYYEINPILGKYPSQNEVDLYFAVSWMAKTGIAYVLPAKWRRGWQISMISISAICVGHNYSIGIRGEF